MGKGYNNFMSKKPFHPGSRDNIKRVWMAEQRSIDEKKKEEDMRLQYEKEQDLYNNRVLVAGSDSKDKLSLNFMYEAPAGIRKDTKEIDDTAEPEYKFEWQRHAPRESFAKNNMDIRDQPFGIQVRNVRCLKCHKWGHVNTDRECPLYNAGSLVEDSAGAIAKKSQENDESKETKAPATKSEQAELIRDMRDEQGLALKRSLYGSYGARQKDGNEANQLMLAVKDPEVAFLDSLSAKEKKKLLKKLQKITNAQRGIKDDGKVKKSKKSKKNKDKEKKKKDKKRSKRESSDSEDSSEESNAQRNGKM